MSAHFALSAETTFAAAHTLPGVELCERLHGHNWRVRLTVRVEESDLDPGGMAVDFRDIERALEESVADLDHRYLNDLAAFRASPPTAERIAQLISGRTAEWLASAAPSSTVQAVDVWETAQYRVTYRPA